MKKIFSIILLLYSLTGLTQTITDNPLRYNWIREASFQGNTGKKRFICDDNIYGSGIKGCAFVDTVINGNGDTVWTFEGVINTYAIDSIEDRYFNQYYSIQVDNSGQAIALKLIYKFSEDSLKSLGYLKHYHLGNWDEIIIGNKIITATGAYSIDSDVRIDLDAPMQLFTTPLLGGNWSFGNDTRGTTVGDQALLFAYSDSMGMDFGWIAVKSGKNVSRRYGQVVHSGSDTLAYYNQIDQSASGDIIITFGHDTIRHIDKMIGAGDTTIIVPGSIEYSWEFSDGSFSKNISAIHTVGNLSFPIDTGIFDQVRTNILTADSISVGTIVFNDDSTYIYATAPSDPFPNIWAIQRNAGTYISFGANNSISIQSENQSALILSGKIQYSTLSGGDSITIGSTDKTYIGGKYTKVTALDSFTVVSPVSRFSGAIRASNLLSSTYTPALFNTTNVAASTAYVNGYYRIIGGACAYGKVDIDAALAVNTATVLGVSLPIVSNLTGEEDLGGDAVSDVSVAGLPALSARVKGDPTNDRALISFNSLSLTNDSYSFQFCYQIK